MGKATATAASRITPSSQEIRLRNTPTNSRGVPTRECEKQHYAGKNFTDRQRIKRKAQSWGRRYAALPVAERLAVLGAMMAVEAER